MDSRTGMHQLLLLTGALALAGGLYALPKGIVKPKSSKAELSKDAARSANRDGGTPAGTMQKAEESSGPRPAATGTVADGEGNTTAAAPHTQVDAEHRRELNSLLAKYNAITDPAGRRSAATTLAARYTTAQRYDSAGYYLATVATGQPSEKAWQQAADAYFQAYSFASSTERKKMLGGKAMELYDKVLAANPNNLDAKTNLGMAYMSSDNPVRGVTLLREVLAQDPKNEKVLYDLGILAMQSNQLDKAAERFGQLVQVNPNNVEGQFYLGIALARTNRPVEARIALLKAKSLSNDPALAASVEEALRKL
ncbi:MAG: tetratricopeptide repeat protein [Janthinobacterium lividum]